MLAKDLMYCKLFHRGFTTRMMPRLVLTLLLLSGAVYATPIAIDHEELSGAKALTGHMLHAKSAAVLKTASLTQTSRMMADDMVQPEMCLFSSNCGSTTKVPEPQSLVLMGSGLLSMAAMIRRRLIRR
jgi:hypothetical protein